jgi:hypothetical protein
MLLLACPVFVEWTCFVTSWCDGGNLVPVNVYNPSIEWFCLYASIMSHFMSHWSNSHL